MLSEAVATEDVPVGARVHFRLGQFSDGLYTQSEERLKSPEWAQSEKLRARNEEELNALKKEKSEKKQRLSRGSGSLSREEASALEEETKMLHRRIYPLEKQVLLDREEVNFILNERVKWLITALQAYRRCIEAGAQGGHKLARGYEPVETVSAHWFADAGFRSAVEDFLERERAGKVPLPEFI